MKNTYKFIGYDKALDDKQILFAVEVLVSGEESEAKALIKAKKMAKRKHYYLKECWKTPENKQPELQPEVSDFIKEFLAWIKKN